MHHRILCPLLIVCCNVTTAFSQLFVSNTGEKKVQLAIGYYSSALLNAGWMTQGWYVVEPKTTVALITTPLNNRYYYVYGQVIGCDSEYAGNSELLIDPTNAFAINKADKPETLQANPRYAARKFIQVDAGQSTRDTVTLTQANCTLNGKKEGEWTIYFDRDWEQTQFIEDASYYRKIRYQNGVPQGIVRDYYMSGKPQWEGKLKSDSPEIPHGTCTWYYESGIKSQECVYDNGRLMGDYKEWDADGTPIKYHKTYQVASILTPQKFFINNPYRLGGKSRIVLPVKLPENTVSWYYTFAASRDEQEIADTQQSLSLLGDLTNLVDQTKMASIAINLLAAPTGANVCDVYLLDEENQVKFSNSEGFSYKINGSRENYTSGTVPIDNFSGDTHYLGIENPTALYGIHFTIEIVAVTVVLEKEEN